MAADFSGEDQNALFETYAFLFVDVERNAHWIATQIEFRRRYRLGSRRMAFKSLRDAIRRRALTPFLRRALSLTGALVVFAIPKGRREIFEPTPPGESEHPLKLWKAQVQEKLLRIVHISSLFCGAFSVPNQDLYWVIDEDSIAANDEQLIQLTSVFSNISSHYLEHSLGHLKCGTTKSDAGDRQLEDFASVSDLAAGGLAELLTQMAIQGKLPRLNLTLPIPKSLSWKARTMVSWLSAEEGSLRRKIFILEPNLDRPGSTLGPLALHPISWPLMPA